jgi:hypothetical protein
LALVGKKPSFLDSFNFFVVPVHTGSSTRDEQWLLPKGHQLNNHGGHCDKMANAEY